MYVQALPRLDGQAGALIGIAGELQLERPERTRRLAVQTPCLFKGVAGVEAEHHPFALRVEVRVLHGSRLHEIEPRAAHTLKPTLLRDDRHMPGRCRSLENVGGSFQRLGFVGAGQPRPA